MDPSHIDMRVQNRYDFTCTQEERDLFRLHHKSTIDAFIEKKTAELRILYTTYHKPSKKVEINIVKEIKKYFYSQGDIDCYCVYKFNFEESYKAACRELTFGVPPHFWQNARIFLSGTKNVKSPCHSLPTELLMAILMLNMSIYTIPDCESFQIKIWKQIDRDDELFLKNVRGALEKEHPKKCLVQ